MEMISLLKPQENAPENQQRFVLVNGSKVMLIKMEFQFRVDGKFLYINVEFAIKK